MKFILAAFTAFCASLASADPAPTHLTFNNGTMHAHAQWVAEPQVGVEAFLNLDWKNGADHGPMVAPGAIEVSLWMPAHNHGSRPTKVVELKDNNNLPILGSYQVQKIFFSMPGTWEVRIKVTYPDGSSETQKFEKTLGRQGGGHRH